MVGSLGSAIRQIFDERIVVSFTDQELSRISHTYHPFGRQVQVVAGASQPIEDILFDVVGLAVWFLPEYAHAKASFDHTKDHAVNALACCSAGRAVDRFFTLYHTDAGYICDALQAERIAYERLRTLPPGPEFDLDPLRRVYEVHGFSRVEQAEQFSRQLPLH